MHTNGAARLIRIFLSELDERLSDFDADLNALADAASEAERAETVTRLFRGAHSLKGAAASVGASGIETVCQQLEDVLAKVRDGQLALDAERRAALSAAAAEVRDAGRTLAEQAAPAPASAPEPAPAPAPAPAAPPRRAPSRIQPRADTLRVAAERIDALLERSGELLVSHHRIDDLLRQVDDAATTVARLHAAPPGAGRKQHREELRQLHRSIERIATAMQAERAQLQHAAVDLDERIRALRMLPFGMACEGLDRVVRDAAEATGKQVRLEIDGADIGVDRAMIERLRDPLVHLVRNAVDHGIEPPAERVRLGKPAAGTIKLSVSPREREVAVRVTDDGRGLDLEALRRRVTERDLAVAEDDLAQAVFLPGISTAATVTTLSGRGVGLDVVRADLEALGGSAEVESAQGSGTTFVLSFPLTVTTVRVVLFLLSGRTFAFNVTSVERVVRIDPEAVALIEGRAALRYGEKRIPFVPLHEVLGIERSGDAALPPVAVVVNRRGHSVAMGVDALLDEREVYLRSLGSRLGALPKISGAAIAGDGSIALVLRAAPVIESALAKGPTLRAPLPAPDQTVAAKRVLLVDDSITTRALERSILEAAGYEVLTAADGHDAWTLLAEHPVDLVVSDVDMPRMNGFALVEAVRASASLRELPVILVTARESEVDRQRGLESGADAYIVKSSFRQEELLEAIGELT